MQYLDALEGLRSQGFPHEEVAVRRYEIMQRFIEGVRSFEQPRTHVCARAVCGYTPNGVSPTIHSTTVPAHAWFGPFGDLSCTSTTTTTTTCLSQSTKPGTGTSRSSAIQCPTIPATTRNLQTTTAANVFQLWRPLALRG